MASLITPNEWQQCLVILWHNQQHVFFPQVKRMFLIKHYFASWPYAHIQGEFQEAYPVLLLHMTLTAKVVDHFHESGYLSGTVGCVASNHPVLSIALSRCWGFVHVWEVHSFAYSRLVYWCFFVWSDLFKNSVVRKCCFLPTDNIEEVDLTRTAENSTDSSPPPSDNSDNSDEEVWFSK